MLRKLWFKNRMIWRVRWDRACICQRGWDFDMPVLVAEVWLVKREFNYWWAGGWYEIINGWWDLSLRFRLHGGPWWLMFHLHDWCSWIQVPSGYDIHSSPWKDPPFLSSVNHLFRLGPSIPWRTVSHNQRLFQAVIFGIGSWGFRVDPCLPKRCYNECIYIHIHTYTYIYIHIHTTYTYIYIHIHTYTYIYIYIYISYGFIWRFPKMRLPPYQVSKTHGDFGIHHRLTHREVQAALRRPDSHRRPGHSIWGHFGIPWYTKLIKVCMVLIDISIIQYLHLDTYMVHHGIYNIFQMIYHDIKPYKCRY